MARQIRLLVCDLDNTIYDWVSYFVPSLYAMVETASEILGCEHETLLDDLRAVHRRHHDSEYPFALLETEVVNHRFSGLSKLEKKRQLEPAFHAFNSMRKKTLRAYPDVEESLRSLVREGVTLVAHTESNLLAVVDRLRRLKLQKYFSRIYCRYRPEVSHPELWRADAFLSDFPMDRVVELSHHQRKPNTDVLGEICEAVGATASTTAYIGDSITRDVKMASDFGAMAIWAKYGTHHPAGYYDKLVRVTHWTSEDVQRERALSLAAKEIVPNYVAETGFKEVLMAVGIAQMQPSQ